MAMSKEDQEIFGVPKKVDPIDFSKVHAMFNSASENGLKKPRFHAEGGIYLSLAPTTGRNPGAIYVTIATEYVGKIIDGNFKPYGLVTPKDISVLRKIAENPQEYAVEYGRKTGTCCICSRQLTADESVKYGIGPICAARYGFTFEATEVAASPATQELPVGETIILEQSRAFITTEIGIISDTAICILSYTTGNNRYQTFIETVDGPVCFDETDSKEQATTQFNINRQGRRYALAPTL